MRDGFFKSLKRWVFWDFQRGSVQYDVMVSLILAFIFLTPSTVFRDQPKPSPIVLLAHEGGSPVFWIDAALLERVPVKSKTERVTAMVRRTAEGRRLTITRLEPVFDSEQNIKGYMAFASPGN